MSFTAKGYITVKVLRDILHELDDKIPPGDLDLMIEEIDADGSGTVDFEGKCIFNCCTSARPLILFYFMQFPEFMCVMTG